MSSLENVRAGLDRALAGGPLASIGVDGWGVDYGLLGERRTAALRSAQLPQPAHRAGGATSSQRARGGRAVPPHGRPADADQHDLPARRPRPRRARAERTRLVMLPELVGVRAVTGEAASERTNAGTTGPARPRDRRLVGRPARGRRRRPGDHARARAGRAATRRPSRRPRPPRRRARHRVRVRCQPARRRRQRLRLGRDVGARRHRARRAGHLRGRPVRELLQRARRAGRATASSRT